MKSLTVAPAEVYNQEKGHLAQTTHVKYLRPWPALNTWLAETFLQVKPEHHEGTLTEEFISTTVTDHYCAEHWPQR